MTQTGTGWTVIVLAGQRPGADPLAHHFGERLKALVPLAGEAMITRVVRTLKSVDLIERIVVLAQQPDTLAEAVRLGGDAEFETSERGISASIAAIAGTSKAPWPLLVTTADHPLLTAEMITGFLAQAATGDLAVGMVERRVMLAAYPDNKRTWLKFRDGHWSGANLFALNNPAAGAALELWAKAEQDRKQAWKLFMNFGPWLALRALTRSIGLAHALALAGKRLGFDARLIPMHWAEAAIDVDKPSDHMLAEEILRQRPKNVMT